MLHGLQILLSSEVVSGSANYTYNHVCGSASAPHDMQKRAAASAQASKESKRLSLPCREVQQQGSQVGDTKTADQMAATPASAGEKVLQLSSRGSVPWHHSIGKPGCMPNHPINARASHPNPTQSTWQPPYRKGLHSAMPAS